MTLFSDCLKSTTKYPNMIDTLLNNSPRTLLYFYPKDDTPGCTLEAQDFTRLVPDFAKLGIQIIGVSQDSEVSHEKFCNKHSLSIQLISDESGEIHEQFGVIGEKKNY